MFTLPATTLPAASIAHNVTTAAKLRFMSDPPRLVYCPGNYADETAGHGGRATVVLSCETAHSRRPPPFPRLRPIRPPRAVLSVLISCPIRSTPTSPTLG